MNSLSAEEFLKLIEESQDQDFEEEVANNTYKAGKPISGIDRKVLNATELKKKDIIDALCSCTNISVGEFLIRIDAYRGSPQTNGSDLNLDVTLFEKISQNNSYINNRINTSIDDRFKNRHWSEYFDTNGKAFNIPADTIVDVVKWLQALTKLTIFL